MHRSTSASGTQWVINFQRKGRNTVIDAHSGNGPIIKATTFSSQRASLLLRKRFLTTAPFLNYQKLILRR